MNNEESSAMSHVRKELAHVTIGGVSHPWHIDQFGHMNVRWYAHFFDDSSFHFFSKIGLDQTTLTETMGVHTVTAQSTTKFRSEVLAGTCFQILARITRIGGKSLTLEYQMTDTSGETVYAICETVEVFVDAKTHKSTTIPETLRAKLESVQHRQD